jgi:hypothetical protein
VETGPTWFLTTWFRFVRVVDKKKQAFHMTRFRTRHDKTPVRNGKLLRGKDKRDSKQITRE